MPGHAPTPAHLVGNVGARPVGVVDLQHAVVGVEPVHDLEVVHERIAEDGELKVDGVRVRLLDLAPAAVQAAPPADVDLVGGRVGELAPRERGHRFEVIDLFGVERGPGGRGGGRRGNENEQRERGRHGSGSRRQRVGDRGFRAQALAGGSRR